MHLDDPATAIVSIDCTSKPSADWLALALCSSRWACLPYPFLGFAWLAEQVEHVQAERGLSHCDRRDSIWPKSLTRCVESSGPRGNYAPGPLLSRVRIRQLLFHGSRMFASIFSRPRAPRCARYASRTDSDQADRCRGPFLFARCLSPASTRSGRRTAENAPFASRSRTYAVHRRPKGISLSQSAQRRRSIPYSLRRPDS